MDDEDDDWEICNDNGFVFKRRLRCCPDPPPSTDPDADLRGHLRARKKQSLLAIRDRYAAELARWDSLSSFLPPSPSPPPTTTSSAPCTPPPSRLPPIDELLSLVEAQEAMIQRLGEICECVEAACEERERLLAQALLDLPIWGSPRSLIASLSD